MRECGGLFYVISQISSVYLSISPFVNRNRPFIHVVKSFAHVSVIKVVGIMFALYSTLTLGESL